MKAPTKIYVDESKISPLGGLLDAIVPENRVEASDICYIRKDTLLEWLKERVEWYKGEELEIAYLRVIDKLNEM